MQIELLCIFCFLVVEAFILFHMYMTLLWNTRQNGLILYELRTVSHQITALSQFIVHHTFDDKDGGHMTAQDDVFLTKHIIMKHE